MRLNPFSGMSRIAREITRISTLNEAAAEIATRELGSRLATSGVDIATGSLFALGSIVGATTILDSINRSRERRAVKMHIRAQEDRVEAKRSTKKEDRWAGMIDPDMHRGIVQELFNNRIGHTNSWGGRRY